VFIRDIKIHKQFNLVLLQDSLLADLQPMQIFRHIISLINQIWLCVCSNRSSNKSPWWLFYFSYFHIQSSFTKQEATLSSTDMYLHTWSFPNKLNYNSYKAMIWYQGIPESCSFCIIAILCLWISFILWSHYLLSSLFCLSWINFFLQVTLVLVLPRK
jgi:hypothetical protein